MNCWQQPGELGLASCTFSSASTTKDAVNQLHSRGMATQLHTGNQTGVVELAGL
jgi:hypothetical protein